MFDNQSVSLGWAATGEPEGYRILGISGASNPSSFKQ